VHRFDLRYSFRNFYGGFVVQLQVTLERAKITRNPFR
jgi:hypothetical protein